MRIKLCTVIWLGDSRKQLKLMPDEVQDVIGWQLQQVQAGIKPKLAKVLKGIGSGVFEIVKRFNSDTYRAVYAVQLGETVYVLHCFQKKSKHGISTPKQDINLIKQRYQEALELFKKGL